MSDTHDRQPLDAETLKDLNDRFAGTINRGDAAAAAELFTDDAFQLQPGFEKPFRGREAIEQMYVVWIDQTGVQYDEATVLDFGSEGDLGYQIVRQTNVQPKRGDKKSGGLFLTLLRRQPDNTWKIYAYISTV